MLDKNFIPPKIHIAERETKRRINIIEGIIPQIMQYSSAMILTGSMAYGQDYSITPESDIDLQILITPEIITKIGSCKYFQKYNTKRIIEWFTNGIFEQFSLKFLYKEISVECHFWDEKTYKEILLYKKESVVRLRSQTKKIATDYAYSFDAEEDRTEYPDYKCWIYNVWVFPAYRMKNKKLFLARPITNILGNAIVLFDECNFSETINECRNITENKINEAKKEEWKSYTIFNTMPGKNKISEEVKIMLI